MVREKGEMIKNKFTPLPEKSGVAISPGRRRKPHLN
jgi:hypothetical protein